MNGYDPPSSARARRGTVGDPPSDGVRSSKYGRRSTFAGGRSSFERGPPASGGTCSLGPGSRDDARGERPGRGVLLQSPPSARGEALAGPSASRPPDCEPGHGESLGSFTKHRAELPAPHGGNAPRGRQLPARRGCRGRQDHPESITAQTSDRSSVRPAPPLGNQAPSVPEQALGRPPLAHEQRYECGVLGGSARRWSGQLRASQRRVPVPSLLVSSSRPTCQHRRRRQA